MGFNKYNLFKWELAKDAATEGEYHMPKLDAVTDEIPKELVPFNMFSRCCNAEEKGLHFYVDDYQFERVWNNPLRYLDRLKRFQAVITPDFSMYMVMPKPQQVWNCWRNRVLAYWMQKNGVNIIPNVGWGDLSTLAWAFDGIPNNSLLSITTQGCMSDHVCMQSLVNGLHTLVKVKEPIGLIVYGDFKEEWYKRFPMPIYRFPSFAEQKWGNSNG